MFYDTPPAIIRPIEEFEPLNHAKNYNEACDQISTIGEKLNEPFKRKKETEETLQNEDHSPKMEQEPPPEEENEDKKQSEDEQTSVLPEEDESISQ
jgi:hypothetical protein